MFYLVRLMHFACVTLPADFTCTWRLFLQTLVHSELVIYVLCQVLLVVVAEKKLKFYSAFIEIWNAIIRNWENKDNWITVLWSAVQNQAAADRPGGDFL